MNKALILGVTGQDGSYLSELLLDKGYIVDGLMRRSSVPTCYRLYNVISNPNFKIIEGDVSDTASIFRIIDDGQYDEVYNLAAMSHVGSSFFQPYAVAYIDYLGELNVLEAIRKYSPPNRHYFAGTSESFGSSINKDGFQNELTPFLPNSPYAVCKVAAEMMVRVYRESYGLWACYGILFNHESPRRGENFLTRKVTRYIGRLIASDFQLPEKLQLGNLNSFRDWGHAQDFVRAMWMMLQQDKPIDYVVGTNKTHSVKEFVERAFQYGGGLDYKEYIEINPEFIRPLEVPFLCADSSRIRLELGWKPEITFDELVDEMVSHDIKVALKEKDYN